MFFSEIGFFCYNLFIFVLNFNVGKYNVRMKKLILLSFFAFSVFTSNAQVNKDVASNDTVQIYKGANSTSYFFRGEKIGSKELETIVKDNILARDEFRKYKEFGTSAIVLTVAGCGLIAGGLYSYLRNKNIFSKDTSNPNLVYVGLGAVVVTIPLVIQSKKHLRNSVEIFNDSKMRPVNKSVSFNFGVNPNGLCVMLEL